MATVLPALVTSLVLASSPALRYSSQFRTETIFRTPNLTEREDQAVIQDLVITPRGQVILYTPRMEVKAILEPQITVGRAFTEPTVELRSFVFLQGEYRLARGYKVWGLESLTYGSFPFEDFRVPAPTGSGGEKLLNTTRYIYSESLLGFEVTSLRRTYIGVMGGLIINGLLDPPTTVLPGGQRVTPAQIGPEVRAQAFHSFTRRLVGGVNVYGRDVHFSTDSRVSLLHAAPLVQYQFHPLIHGRLEVGATVGEQQLQLNPVQRTARSVLHPSGEASLSIPVPVGYHWPVKAKLATRYLSYIDVYSTDPYPRLEGSFGLEWKGRRKAQVNLEVSVAQAVVGGQHARDGDERLSAKVEWPLTRTSAVVASGRLLRLRAFLLDDEPIYKWFMGVGLVIRQENGRL
jgi:hypothetical protein